MDKYKSVLTTEWVENIDDDSSIVVLGKDDKLKLGKVSVIAPALSGDHNKLINKNGDNEFLHVTDQEKSE